MSQCSVIGGIVGRVSIAALRIRTRKAATLTMDCSLQRLGLLWSWPGLGLILVYRLRTVA